MWERWFRGSGKLRICSEQKEGGEKVAEGWWLMGDSQGTGEGAGRAIHTASDTMAQGLVMAGLPGSGRNPGGTGRRVCPGCVHVGRRWAIGSVAWPDLGALAA